MSDEIPRQLEALPKMLTWRIAEAFQEFRGADADAQWVRWSDVLAVLDTEGDRLPPQLADLASAMRKMLPPDLLQQVILHLDPLEAFVQFLHQGESMTEPWAGDPRIKELEWVLNRAEEIIRDEYGKNAAYAFVEAWGQLPKELQTPIKPIIADTEGNQLTPPLKSGHIDPDCEVVRGVGWMCTCDTPEGKTEDAAYRAECEAEREAVAAPEGDASPALRWQPIETAPKDGTNVLLWWPFWCKGRPTIGYFGFHGIQQWAAPEVLEGDGDPPTHWMPLPDPPVQP